VEYLTCVVHMQVASTVYCT